MLDSNGAMTATAPLAKFPLFKTRSKGQTSASQRKVYYAAKTLRDLLRVHRRAGRCDLCRRADGPIADGPRCRDATLERANTTAHRSARGGGRSVSPVRFRCVASRHVQSGQ